MSQDDAVDLAASIDRAELDRMLGLLRRIFDIRITFYDGGHAEHEDFDIKGRTDYCSARRQDPAFRARCDACDRTHLKQARERRAPVAYRCHDGLFEAVVPIHDRAGHYLGSFMLGQLRPADERGWQGPEAALRQAMPAVTRRRVDDVAELLHRMADHLLAHQVLARQNRPWAEAAHAHIEAHLGQRVLIAGLARAIGRSPSFVSHAFRTEFGMPLHRYLVERRLTVARERLLRGEAIPAVAAALGFCDEFHLSRAFTRRWGVPPSRLRSGG